MNTKTHTDEEIVAHFAKLGFALHEIKDNIFREEKTTLVFQTDHKNHTVDASTILYKDAENIYQALAKARADQDRIARAEELEKIQKVMQILTYISTRNREHNAVCIPKAKEALEILTTQYNNTV